MISDNLPDAIHKKNGQHSAQNQAKNTNDNDDMFRLWFNLFLQRLGRKKNIKMMLAESEKALTLHSCSSSSQRNLQFILPLHRKSADIQVASSQSYSSSSQAAK